MDESIIGRIFDPRLGSDRIQALLQSFTAPASSCPFYSDHIRSNCALDPSSWRAWRCEGICFIEGFCCNRITNKAEEIDELIKFLQIFSLGQK